MNGCVTINSEELVHAPVLLNFSKFEILDIH